MFHLDILLLIFKITYLNMSITPVCRFNIWKVNFIYINSILKPFKTKWSCNRWRNLCSCYVVFWFEGSIRITWEEVMVIYINTINFVFTSDSCNPSQFWAIIETLFVITSSQFPVTFNFIHKVISSPPLTSSKSHDTTLWYWLYS